MFKPAQADAAAASKLRPDHKRLQTIYGDRRSVDRLIAHYQLERRLADRLRHATPTERGTLYGQLYSELYAVIADHPQHTAARNADSRRVNEQIELIARHIGHTTIFVEIGCDDAALSVAAAKYVGVSVGVDVTDALLPAHTSNNFQFVKTDGVKLDFASGSVDFAYSNQLMEHLHRGRSALTILAEESRQSHT